MNQRQSKKNITASDADTLKRKYLKSADDFIAGKISRAEYLEVADEFINEDIKRSKAPLAR